MTTELWVNAGSDDGLVHDGTKPSIVLFYGVLLNVIQQDVLMNIYMYFPDLNCKLLDIRCVFYLSLAGEDR